MALAVTAQAEQESRFVDKRLEGIFDYQPSLTREQTKGRRGGREGRIAARINIRSAGRVEAKVRSRSSVAGT
jgi:hypothetical protein